MENPASCEVLLVLLGPLSLCRNTAGKWVTAQRSEQPAPALPQGWRHREHGQGARGCAESIGAPALRPHLRECFCTCEVPVRGTARVRPRLCFKAGSVQFC